MTPYGLPFQFSDRLVFGWPLKTAPPFQKQRGDMRTAQSNKLNGSPLGDLSTSDGASWQHGAVPGLHNAALSFHSKQTNVVASKPPWTIVPVSPTHWRMKDSIPISSSTNRCSRQTIREQEAPDTFEISTFRHLSGELPIEWLSAVFWLWFEILINQTNR